MIRRFQSHARWIPACQPRPAELILFFDGVCGLCNTAVDLVLREDREERFKFSPLQGPLAASRLPTQQITDLQSLVLIEDGRSFVKSAAILRIAAHLGGLWRCAAAIGAILPASLGDGLYTTLARHRYRLFGKRDHCRLPSRDEKMRFL